MPGEGIVSIGATFDKTNVDAGLGDTQAMVKASMESITADVTQAAAKTRSAWKNLGEDVKAAAATVTSESLKVAEATKLQAQAFSDLRRATILSRDAKLSETQQSAILAAAQTKVAETTAAVAAAKRAEAEAVATAAEEEALSQNVIIRAFQRAAAVVTESSAEIREQMVATAETGGLEAEGITAGFAGFSKLLGAGIAVGFAANYIDGVAKMNVELEHLSVQSGISITNLAGLQQIVREMGGEWEPVATGLVKMNRSLADSKEPSKALVEALAGINLKIEDLRGKHPEEQLQIISKAFAETGNAGNVANAALAIFSKGGAALIPVLKEQGAQLEANMKRTGELTGVTEESAEAARRWTQDTARLSAQFRSVMIPVMEHAEDVVRRIAFVFESAAALMMTVFEGVGAAITSILAPIAKVSLALYDLMTGQFAKAIAEAKDVPTAFTNQWKGAFDNIKNYWAEVKATLTGSTPVPKIEPGGDEGQGYVATPKKGHNEAFQRDEQQLNQLRLATAQRGYALGVDGEIKFWKDRLAAAKQGSQEYESIVAKLANLEEQALKQRRDPKPGQLAQVQTPDLSKDAERAIAEMTAEEKEAAKQQIQAQREEIDEKIRLAQEGYRAAEENANAEVRMYRMTSQERITALKAAADQEYQIELGLIRAKEILDNGEAQKYQQDLNRELQLTRQHDQQIAQLNRQSAEQTQKIWLEAYQKMTAGFNDAVARWVVTGQGFAQSMAQMMGSITENFTRNVMKMAEQFLLGIMLQKQGQKSQIFADAKTAAANTYSAVSAIPYVGPFLAPPAAAAAFAGVMAFDSFGDGGVVRGGGGMAVPVLAHAGERVLTPSQTQNFESLVNSRTESRTSNNRVEIGGLTQNFHGARATPREAARGMKDAIRRGRLGYA
jgi:hypothetical protein